MLALVTLAGCAAHASRHGARVLAPGTWRTVLALDGVVFEHGRAYTVRPAPEVAVRRGMVGCWDLGGKLGAGSLEVSARFRRVAGPRLAVALVAGLRGGLAIATNNTSDLFRTTAFGHVVVERAVARRTALVVTGTAAATVADSGTLFAGTTADTRVLLEPALGLGLRRQLGGVVLWPELTVTLPYAAGDGVEPPVLQAGLGLEL